MIDADDFLKEEPQRYNVQLVVRVDQKMRDDIAKVVKDSGVSLSKLMRNGFRVLIKDYKSCL